MCLSVQTFLAQPTVVEDQWVGILAIIWYVMVPTCIVYVVVCMSTFLVIISGSLVYILVIYV
jgi:hypothetical protein